MGNSIFFNNQGIINITKGSSKVKVKVGDTSLNMSLLTGLEGTQPYRTQIDVALDETTYTIGAGRALGNQVFGLIDGPFACKTDTDNVLKTLAKMKSLKSRELELTISSPTKTQFKGLISSFNIKLDDTLVEGSYYILVSVTAMGMWTAS